MTPGIAITSPPKRSSAAVAYGLAAIGGSFFVFLSSGLWVMPVGAMFLYLFFGYKEARKGGLSLEFGDSFYYLGFTLTVASLLASLRPFTTATVRPEEVLKSFGLGLLTTLIGVIGRTVIQMFYQTPSERIESINAELETQAQAFLDQLQRVNRGVLSSLSRSTTRLAASFEEKLTSYEGHLGALNDSMKKAVETFEAISINDRGVHNSLKALESTIAGGGESAERALKGLVRSIDDSSTRIGKANVDTSRLQSALNLVSDAAAAAAGPLSGVKAASEGATQALNSIRGQLGSLDISTLQQSVNQLTRSVGEARTSLSTVGTKAVSEALAPLSSALTETLAQARKLNLVLDEIAEAVAVKLEKL
jgi:hypothetical protein